MTPYNLKLHTICLCVVNKTEKVLVTLSDFRVTIVAVENQ